MDTSTLDAEIREYIKAEQIEIDLMLDWGASFDSSNTNSEALHNITNKWPSPSASSMWYKGLRKYGKLWSIREYELSERSKI